MLDEQQRQARRSKHVLGTMAFMFYLAEERAVLPPTSMEVTLVIVSRDTDHQYRQQLVNDLQRGWSGFESASREKDKREGHFNFTISLPPGEYLVDSVEIMASELDQGRITIPANIRFTVPAEAECVYIGRTLLRFSRLAPGRYSEQRQRSRDVIFFRSGGFIPIHNTVDIPALDEQLVVRLGKELYQEAQQRNCTVQLAVP